MKLCLELEDLESLFVLIERVLKLAAICENLSFGDIGLNVGLIKRFSDGY